MANPYARLAAVGAGEGVCYYFGFMQTGIIGLGQVGKTTLFRILTKAAVEGTHNFAGFTGKKEDSPSNVRRTMASK